MGKCSLAWAAIMLTACNAREQPAAQAQREEPVTATRPDGRQAAASETPAARTEATPAVSACLMQGDKPLAPNRLRAVGTEPFWGARIEGRCVTWSTPEDQDGTRLWTQFSGRTDHGEWRGSLDGRPFVLRTRPDPGCSDGMSDTVYPIAVTVMVAGEQRAGCAAPL